jgi:hypothetical protein
MMNDLFYGYGPCLKGLALSYLCYVVFVNNYKIPIMFFILYGLGSLAFVHHLLVIKEKDSTLVDAGIYEQFFNVILCTLTIIYIINKKY